MFISLRSMQRVFAALLAAAPSLLAQQEIVDTATIRRFYTEEAANGQVMSIASWLTDVYGPRLTGSPGARAAGDWTVKTLKEWGLANAGLEFWSPKFPGWRNDRLTLQAIAPTPFAIEAAPRAWSPGTKGPLSGDAVSVLLASWADTAKYAGQLRGKFVLLGGATVLRPHLSADARRLGDADLAKLAADTVPDPRSGGFVIPRDPAALNSMMRRFSGSAFRPANDTAALRWMERQGVVAILLPARGDDGTIFTDNGYPRTPGVAQVPMLHVAGEHYGRITRTLEKGMPVRLALDFANTITPEAESFNIVAEIPGTDPTLKEEVVMLGAHFDSWHAATGATDNAAGSAVMLEAIRLIKASGLKPRRTIRIGLWTGEEQGLIGSREYVARHLGERVFATDTAGFRATDTVTALPGYAKHAGYFNVDNGTGRIRGVYLQGNTQVKDAFTQWIAPLREYGVTTISAGNTGGTDHQAFDAIGLGGWQFIQDPVDYDTRTHHSNQDLYERLVPDDMKHNAAVVAAFVWQAAQRNTRLQGKAGWPIVRTSHKQKAED
jgi:carboxypeptidase Q